MEQLKQHYEKGVLAIAMLVMGYVAFTLFNDSDAQQTAIQEQKDARERGGRKSTLGVIVIFAVVPLIKLNKMYELFINNKAKGTVCLLTFLSTLIFPILSIELFSGINTHIWTGIIFGFLLSLIIEKI